MTPVRIFISSVMSEFAEERQRLYDYIRTDALLKLFFEPYLFEANPASDSKTQEIFLRAAGESEIYVGIWGLQYGNGDFRVTIMRPEKGGEGQSSGQKSGQKGGQKGGQNQNGFLDSTDVILEIISQNPSVIRAELCEQVGMASSAVQKHIEKLKTQGKIRRIGGDRGGHWEVLS